MMKCAFVIERQAEEGISGVVTFIETFRVMMRDHDVRVVELPTHHEHEQRLVREAADTHEPIALKPRRSLLPSGLALLLGYGRSVLCDVRRLWPYRQQLKSRILITNELGCESLPVALRLVCPRNTLIAIAHTHPGQNAEAQHPVRRMMERLCYRAVTDIIYNSHSLKAQWAAKLGIAEAKGAVIWHGVDAPDPTLPSD